MQEIRETYRDNGVIKELRDRNRELRFDGLCLDCQADPPRLGVKWSTTALVFAMTAACWLGYGIGHRTQNGLEQSLRDEVTVRRNQLSSLREKYEALAAKENKK